MEVNPVLLHLESATKVCSVAVSRGDELLALVESAEGNKHSMWMTSYIKQAMSEAKLHFDDLSSICISMGPGSYTGLRVAYSVAKGLGYARGLSIIEVDTLRSIALAYLLGESPLKTKNIIVLSMIDARRMEVYLQGHDHEGKIAIQLEAHILTPDSFNAYSNYDQIIIVGDGAWKVNQLELDPEISQKVIIDSSYVCSAKHLVRESVEKYQNAAFADLAYCTPQYLKSPNITTPKKTIFTK